MTPWGDPRHGGARVTRRVLLGTALVALIIWTVAAFAAGQKYERADWPHWRPVAEGCRDVRQQVLERDGLSSDASSPHGPRWAYSERRCWIISGQWVDPYAESWRILTDPSELDIDHTLPLALAHAWGGATWSKDRRADYANDLGFRYALRVTDRTINRSKGAQPPSAWQPPALGARCDYGRNLATVIVIWGLDPPEAERAAIRTLVETC